jgi:carbohydrate-selective porin OprB
MRTGMVAVLAAMVAVTPAVASGALADEQKAAPITTEGGDTTFIINAPESPPGWLERNTLTGDWDGGRTWLKEHGITLMPRLTQFYQGLSAGDDDHGYDYGGKADLLLKTELAKLGFWEGFSMTVHAEHNFGQSVNGAGGTIAPVNTALYLPGMEGADAFDLSSVYLGQTFSDAVSLVFGKINIIDIASGKPFMSLPLSACGSMTRTVW